MHLIVARQSIDLTGPLNDVSLANKYTDKEFSPLLKHTIHAIEAKLSDGHLRLQAGEH